MRFRTFPELVGPRILSLESVDYFATSEQKSVVKKQGRILISKPSMSNCSGFVNFHCMQTSKKKSIWEKRETYVTWNDNDIVFVDIKTQPYFNNSNLN